MILDYRAADLSSADRALCDWAVKLTLAPGDMTERDIERLRAHGYSDDQTTIAAQVVGYFNYINRVGDGLGVDDEPWMTPPKEEWLRRREKNWHEVVERLAGAD